jgi:hypothetical protein
MRSFVRKSATIGLIGGTVLASLLGQGLSALALPEADIVKVLQQVPVFTVADAQGAPLIAVTKNDQGKDVRVTGVFISQQDAQKFFQQLQKDKPDIASKVKVRPVSLAEVYKLAAANANKPNALDFAYVPMPGEVDSAKKILSEGGKQYQGGVPLFVARGGKEQGFLTIQQNNEQIIPFFFEKQQLQVMVDRFKKEKPDMASTIKIEVVPLESMMATMKQSNDEMLTKIRLIPSEETIQFMQSLQPPTQQPKK